MHAHGPVTTLQGKADRRRQLERAGHRDHVEVRAERPQRVARPLQQGVGDLAVIASLDDQDAQLVFDHLGPRYA